MFLLSDYVRFLLSDYVRLVVFERIPFDPIGME